MKINFTKERKLYLISDRDIACLSHSAIAKKALTAGVKIIQLREKKLSKKEIFAEASSIRKFTRSHNAILIINDYIDIALAVDADGVHLGQDDMPMKEARKILGNKRIIGISTHSVKQAVKAQEEGADYIGFGPIFHTSTKDAGRPKGLKMLEEVRRNISIPIAAIGGITSDTASKVLSSGADAVAVGSAILRGDMKNNIDIFLSVIK
ncbi:MAG: thiamine phosphate synthase [Thermodesulfovibrionia bacterium]|nr:thiamine phosphate synthase [Thermodesulfovibrionia bacterium]